jgi:hypothetical protein
MIDVTSRITYKNVPAWHRDLVRVCENIPVVLVGNKVDFKERKVKAKQITFHRKKNLAYYYDHLTPRATTSSKSPSSTSRYELTGIQDLAFLRGACLPAARGGPLQGAGGAAGARAQRGPEHAAAGGRRRPLRRGEETQGVNFRPYPHPLFPTTFLGGTPDPARRAARAFRQPKSGYVRSVTHPFHVFGSHRPRLSCSLSPPCPSSPLPHAVPTPLVVVMAPLVLLSSLLLLLQTSVLRHDAVLSSDLVPPGVCGLQIESTGNSSSSSMAFSSVAIEEVPPVLSADAVFPIVPGVTSTTSFRSLPITSSPSFEPVDAFRPFPSSSLFLLFGASRPGALPPLPSIPIFNRRERRSMAVAWRAVFRAVRRDVRRAVNRRSKPDSWRAKPDSWSAVRRAARLGEARRAAYYARLITVVVEDINTRRRREFAHVDPDAPISRLMARISAALGSPVGDHTLVGGEPLDPARSLESYGIKRSCTLRLQMSTSGGGGNDKSSPPPMSFSGNGAPPPAAAAAQPGPPPAATSAPPISFSGNGAGAPRLPPPPPPPPAAAGAGGSGLTRRQRLALAHNSSPPLPVFDWTGTVLESDIIALLAALDSYPNKNDPLLFLRDRYSRTCDGQLSLLSLRSFAAKGWIDGCIIHSFVQSLNGIFRQVPARPNAESPSASPFSAAGARFPVPSSILPPSLYGYLTYAATTLADTERLLNGRECLYGDAIIIPVNIGNFHWIVVVLEPMTRQVHVYDSLAVHQHDLHGSVPTVLTGWASLDAAVRLSAWYDGMRPPSPGTAILPAPWTAHSYGSASFPQQQNGNDCGIFAMSFINALWEGRPFQHGDFDIRAIRTSLFFKHLDIWLETADTDPLPSFGSAPAPSSSPSQQAAPGSSPAASSSPSPSPSQQAASGSSPAASSSPSPSQQAASGSSPASSSPSPSSSSSSSSSPIVVAIKAVVDFLTGGVAGLVQAAWRSSVPDPYAAGLMLTYEQRVLLDLSASRHHEAQRKDAASGAGGGEVSRASLFYVVADANVVAGATDGVDPVSCTFTADPTDFILAVLLVLYFPVHVIPWLNARGSRMCFTLRQVVAVIGPVLLWLSQFFGRRVLLPVFDVAPLPRAPLYAVDNGGVPADFASLLARSVGFLSTLTTTLSSLKPTSPTHVLPPSLRLLVASSPVAQRILAALGLSTAFDHGRTVTLPSDEPHRGNPPVVMFDAHPSYMRSHAELNDFSRRVCDFIIRTWSSALSEELFGLFGAVAGLVDKARETYPDAFLVLVESLRTSENAARDLARLFGGGTLSKNAFYVLSLVLTSYTTSFVIDKLYLEKTASDGVIIAAARGDEAARSTALSPPSARGLVVTLGKALDAVLRGGDFSLDAVRAKMVKYLWSTTGGANPPHPSAPPLLPRLNPFPLSSPVPSRRRGLPPLRAHRRHRRRPHVLRHGPPAPRPHPPPPAGRRQPPRHPPRPHRPLPRRPRRPPRAPRRAPPRHQRGLQPVHGP